MEQLNIFEDISLTNSYNKLSYRNDFNNHIVSVLDFALENTGSEVLKNKDLKFSKGLYWECLNSIYENNPIIRNEEEKEQNRLFEQSLYLNIITKLDGYFDEDDDLLLESIDFTISNYTDDLNYGQRLDFNPWSYSNKIFTEDNLLYTFTDNKDEYKHLLKHKKKESELSKYLTIGVLGKGQRKDYAQSYIKDIYALRTLFLNLLEENKHDSDNPIKFYNIIKQFRDLGISKTDLTDGNIKYWIVKPLKNSVKIGSNKNGYFAILTEADLYESYKSHYSNFIGFHKTLEKHKKHSISTFLSLDEKFNKHNNFLK
ncbi:hypothetical protein RB619_05710 [Flavobacterium sp. LHD-80]|uniref:hypothetical protein n=1 Tax=Flavobacterium sp. LHD-80 TaxID=3071411 RepID=UPI0027DF8B89|nr:hypothetical protein [Flavobacterium sp. LHD-80]MDQ6470131.1 hypothetical protein [Flavobacterium sp. LHD-80]